MFKVFLNLLGLKFYNLLSIAIIKRMSRILARNLSLAARASGAGRSHLDGNVPGPWKTVKFGAPEFSFEEDGTKMVQTATHPEKESKSLTDGGIPETFYDAKKSYQKSARSYAVHPGEF